MVGGCWGGGGREVLSCLTSERVPERAAMNSERCKASRGPQRGGTRVDSLFTHFRQNSECSNMICTRG